MALDECPECGREVKREATECGNCGHSIAENPDRREVIGLGTVGLLGLLIFTGGLVYFAGGSEDYPEAESVAVDACRHHMRQQLSNPETADFARSHTIHQGGKIFLTRGRLKAEDARGVTEKITYACSVYVEFAGEDKRTDDTVTIKSFEITGRAPST